MSVRARAHERRPSAQPAACSSSSSPLMIEAEGCTRARVSREARSRSHHRRAFIALQRHPLVVILRARATCERGEQAQITHNLDAARSHKPTSRVCCFARHYCCHHYGARASEMPQTPPSCARGARRRRQLASLARGPRAQQRRRNRLHSRARARASERSEARFNARANNGH